MLNAKQIENCLDTVSAQEVSGEKSFSSPQAFVGSQRSIVLANGYIYFVANANQLDQNNNTRIYFEGGAMVVEVYMEDHWEPV